MRMGKVIYIAADHAGFKRKEMIKKHLKKQGYTLKDFGAKKLDKNDDYPDYALPLAQGVAADAKPGILLCGSAEGVCMVANKVDGIRAALGYSVFAAKTSRADDNSNVLCVPGRELSDEDAKEIVDAWLDTEFSFAERHKRRLAKIEEIEQNN